MARQRLKYEEEQNKQALGKSAILVYTLGHSYELQDIKRLGVFSYQMSKRKTLMGIKIHLGFPHIQRYTSIC